MTIEKHESIRYSRLESLGDIGAEGVARLRAGRVLVVGCGALGSLCAMYLAASGVGTLGIADFDTIDLSNLQRQLFFAEDQLGQSKSAILAMRIHALNSDVRVIEYRSMITAEKASEIFSDYDFVVDGSDNPATKMMTSRVCERLGVPCCIGGVRGFSGQVSSWAPGHATYAEVFGDVPSCSGFTPCSTGGVLGPAAGIVASVQASEAIKHLTGAGQMLYDSLYVFDLAENSAQELRF